MNGVRQFCEYQYFCYKILFYSFCLYWLFFEPLKSKSTQMLRPQKGNLGVSFNNTLLNFGLYNFRVYTVQVYRVYNNIIIIILHTFTISTCSVQWTYENVCPSIQCPYYTKYIINLKTRASRCGSLNLNVWMTIFIIIDKNNGVKWYKCFCSDILSNIMDLNFDIMMTNH